MDVINWIVQQKCDKCGSPMQTFTPSSNLLMFGCGSRKWLGLGDGFNQSDKCRAAAVAKIAALPPPGAVDASRRAALQ